MDYESRFRGLVTGLLLSYGELVLLPLVRSDVAGTPRPRPGLSTRAVGGSRG